MVMKVMEVEERRSTVGWRVVSSTDIMIEEVVVVVVGKSCRVGVLRGGFRLWNLGTFHWRRE